MMRFEPGQLQQYLIKLENKQVTGVLTLKVNLPQANQTRTIFVAFQQGNITFAGAKLMAPVELVTFIAKKLGSHFLEPALKVVEPRVKDPESVQEILELICQFGLFSWDSLEQILKEQSVIGLELALPYGGGMDFNPNHPFNLAYPGSPGFQYKDLAEVLKERTTAWHSMKKTIEHIDALPILKNASLEAVGSNEIKEHLEQYVNGENSLGTIAYRLRQDPLQLAKRYLQFANKGWIQFQLSSLKSMMAETNSIVSESERPIVLSVDDSVVVQTVIKRSISDLYQVILANNAVDALSLLNTHHVSLLLLDVTMPDIDGLELCRTIRNISKFRDLPVVMLTAKDGILDKVKGQFAGSTHYLTKPIDREKLLAVLEKYIPQAVMS